MHASVQLSFFGWLHKQISIQKVRFQTKTQICFYVKHRTFTTIVKMHRFSSESRKCKNWVWYSRFSKPVDYINLSWLFGISREQFDGICPVVENQFRNRKYSSRTAIGILLTMLRTVLWSDMLKTLFHKLQKICI